MACLTYFDVLCALALQEEAVRNQNYELAGELKTEDEIEQFEFKRASGFTRKHFQSPSLSLSLFASPSLVVSLSFSLSLSVFVSPGLFFYISFFLSLSLSLPN